ncbi:Uncharacterized protein ALO36_02285 [Pseudomonas syringae pv. tomato]|uniref:Uncharacterized protein n=2 Tax=Pseudomonas syringae group TaxID=136849 RepID=A0A0N0FYT5_PSEYM|nr:Uncharacterized protein AC506_0424 [Pseudomonas syringae pv. maculicola str. M6]KPB92376.1 Uncharacterized protein AC503_5163 [Pseudomonas syringae pv. maculicola]KPC10129.1 Uncharacterized protein AC500_4820 [Pseudomonas amygdali pv. lachrymans]KPY93972.1 Uncharacterized protein ALO36_02285 [Pseudomonas syringae pv. tomato]KPB93785.1 Uncharacterized protein AC502_3920 [Pseudomonas syringae pv. maculicola]
MLHKVIPSLDMTIVPMLCVGALLLFWTLCVLYVALRATLGFYDVS